MGAKPPLTNLFVGVLLSLLLTLRQDACESAPHVMFSRAQGLRSNSLATTLVATLLARTGSANAALKTSYATLHLQENISIAKIKFTLVPATYDKAYTFDTLRTFERYGVSVLTANKIAVMYNWCPEQDTYANDFPSNLYLACKTRIEFFSLTGERVHQEFYDTAGILRQQDSFTYFDPERFPEMKAIGFWVHGPHEGAHSNKIVLALWAAVCPEPGQTRECMASASGCRISLRKRGPPGNVGSASETFQNTCMSDLFGKPYLVVKPGLRLCDAGEGSPPWPYQSAPDCFYYDLSVTDSAGKGWEKPADGKADGYRLGSSKTLSKDGGRYGSVYLVRFSAGGAAVEWIKRISAHAFMDYAEGIVNAVHAGEAVIRPTAPGAAATEMQYSVTYYSHYWKRSSSGQVLLKRLCHVQIVRENGELVDAASGGVLNTKCSPCSSPPMVRVHPQSHQWMSVCTTSRGDSPGVYLNDNLVVDSLADFRPSGITGLDPDASVSIDTDAQIVSTGAAEWLLFWRTLVTFPSDPVELFGPYVQKGRLMLAKYDPDSKAFSVLPAAITEGLSEPEYRSPRISRFGEQTLLVGFYSSLKQTTTLLEIREDASIVAAKELQIDRTLVGVLLNRASATEWQHHPNNAVYWLDRGVPTEGLDQYEALRPTIGYPGFSVQLFKVEGHTAAGDCQVKWESGVCDNSCHILHVLREKTPGSNCPLPVGSIKATPCTSGSLCEPIVVSKVIEATLKDLTQSESNASKQRFFKRQRLWTPSSKGSSAASVEGVAHAFSSSATATATPGGGSRKPFSNHESSNAEGSAKLAASVDGRTQGWDSPAVIAPGRERDDPPGSDISSYVAHLFDRNVMTGIDFGNSETSSFAVYLDGGGDIYEFSVAFLLEANRWEEGLRLSCAAYDRFGKALVVRESFIGRLPPRNTLIPAGVNVSYWQWTNVRLFGVQVVQCTSGSPSLLPSSIMTYSINHRLRAPSSSSPPFSPAFTPEPALRSQYGWSLPSGQPTSSLSSPLPRAAKPGIYGRSEARLSSFTPDPVTWPHSRTAPAVDLPSLTVAELVILGRPNGGGECPPEGFFAHANCSSEASRPVFDLATLDCKGEWSEWTVCDANCISQRLFQKEREAAWGGRPCQRIQKRPCGGQNQSSYTGNATDSGASAWGTLFGDGPYCTPSTIPSAVPGGDPLLPRQRPCSYVTGPWSDCLHCRQLRFHQILAEAAGPNVEACPDPIEMRYCNTSCRLQYDFAYTATSTYPPVTTKRHPLPTFVLPSKAPGRLSWSRWYTMGRYAVAAFCLLAVVVLALLAACLYCSFRSGEQQQQRQQQEVSAAADPPVPRAPLTLAELRRKTAAAVHAAVASLIAFAEESDAHRQGSSEGPKKTTETGHAAEPRGLSCEHPFSEDSGCLRQRKERQKIRSSCSSAGTAETPGSTSLESLSTVRISNAAIRCEAGGSAAGRARTSAAAHFLSISRSFVHLRSSRIEDGRTLSSERWPAAGPQPLADTSTLASLDSAPPATGTAEAQDESMCEWEDIDTSSPANSSSGAEFGLGGDRPFNAREGCVSGQNRCCRRSRINTRLRRLLKRRSGGGAKRTSIIAEENGGMGGPSWRRQGPLERV